jgi:methylthioribose-1-phosphate isomerase
MKVNGVNHETIWINSEDDIEVIDQVLLPHEFKTLTLKTVDDVCKAIRDMHVRGAGLIGVTAAFGVWLATREAPQISQKDFDNFVSKKCQKLIKTRPTASNLQWAVKKQLVSMKQGRTFDEKIALVREGAIRISREDSDACRRIGLHGLNILRELSAKKKGAPIQILTHCNAGWLAFVNYGSALAPVYAAHNANIPLHVWVDETRPRNQGASLTAWELGQQGVPHTLISDNTGGHLMQHGDVDIVFVGADRVTRNGDVANKIGTYLKALAAKDNQVPFYACLPSSTFDLDMKDGLLEIPIEERGADEVRTISGVTEGGDVVSVRICPESTVAKNWGFDVTPARLITGLISELGICDANDSAIGDIFREA